MNIAARKYYHVMEQLEDLQERFDNLMNEYNHMADQADADYRRHQELIAKHRLEIDRLKELLRDHGIDSLKARAS